MTKIRLNSLYTTFVLLIFFSCNSLDKEEYIVINKVIENTIYPKTDINLLSKVMEVESINFKKGVEITQYKMSQKQYTFTISDTLYPINLPKDIWENIHNNYLFSEIEGRSDKPLPIDFGKISFKKNMKRILQKTIDSNYIGHFKFHRVLFDKFRERAYVQIETPEYSSPLFIGIFLKKQNGVWVLE